MAQRIRLDTSIARLAGIVVGTLMALGLVTSTVAQEGPSVTIVSPEDGATITTTDIILEIETSGFDDSCQLVGLADADGEGHVHVMIDQPSMAGLTNFYCETDTITISGEGGNIVLAGHDDVRGEVFRGLHAISVGDQVTVTSDAGTFLYEVQEIHVRKYRDVSIEEQLEIGLWIEPMPEERLTLVTCWPYGVNDQRVIVVATPVAED